MAERITIQVGGQEKFIGLLECGDLQLERQKSKHLYQKVNGYGIDKEAITDLQDRCTDIYLTEKESKKVYHTSYETFMKKALPMNYKGHGSQLILPLRYWTDTTQKKEE